MSGVLAADGNLELDAGCRFRVRLCPAGTLERWKIWKFKAFQLATQDLGSHALLRWESPDMAQCLSGPVGAFAVSCLRVCLAVHSQEPG